MLKDPLGKELAQALGHKIHKYERDGQTFYMLQAPDYEGLTEEKLQYVMNFIGNRAKRITEDEAWNDFSYETDGIEVIEHLIQHTKVVTANLHFNVNVGWSAIVNSGKQFTDDEPSIAFVKAWLDAING